MQPPTTTHPEATGAPVPPPTQQPPATNRKKKLAMIIAAAVVLAVAIAAVCLYLFWYQNPQKVVTDALINATQARQVAMTGDFSVKARGGDVTLRFNGEGDQSSGKAAVAIEAAFEGVQIKTQADLVTATDGDIYVRANDVQKAADALYGQVVKGMGGANASAQETEQIKALLKAQFDPIVQKIDNRWIHISAKDVEAASPEVAKAQTCMNEVRTMLREDKKVTNEIANAYKKHQFIQIDEKLGSKDGALGYKVSIDEATAKQFAQATKDATLMKKLRTCGGEESATNSLSKELENAEARTGKSEMKVWIARWTHDLQKLNVTASDDGTDTNLNAAFDFAKKPSVQTPKDATPLSEVIREVEALMQGSASAAL